MCWKTEAGLVHSVGEIELEAPNDHPKFLQKFRYAIFKEEEDMLGLIFHAVCIDLVLDSRSTTPAGAFKGLKNSVYSFIDVTLRHATDKLSAYNALKEQKENRDEGRELVYRAHNEVLAHNETILYAKLRPHYKHLYDSFYSKLQKEVLAKEVPADEFVYLLTSVSNEEKYTNLYTHAYSVEDIENLYKPQKSPDDKIKQIFAINYYLLLNTIRQNQRAMV
jgi:hypothetical protein